MNAFGALSTKREALGQNDPEAVVVAWIRMIPNLGLTPTLLRAFPVHFVGKFWALQQKILLRDRISNRFVLRQVQVRVQE